MKTATKAVIGLVCIGVVIGYVLLRPSATEPTTDIIPVTNVTDVDSGEVSTSAPAATQIKGEVWADNWFNLYADGVLVAEDSVSINTERSFNQETFTFFGTYPIQLAFTAKDFKENDTGLEYIGERNQQMGDGGFIAQFTDLSTGEVVGVTDENVKCIITHTAPLDKTCESQSDPVAGVAPCTYTEATEPANWQSVAFDDAAWEQAVVYSEAAVSPKDGYDEIDWDPQAELIWGDDLEQVNTLLCRMTITS